MHAGMAASTSRLMAFWNHPAGPKTIHFWAPTFKWGITLANVADFWRPAEKISYPQQTAVTATGLIWSRFSTQITPVRLSCNRSSLICAASKCFQGFQHACNCNHLAALFLLCCNSQENDI